MTAPARRRPGPGVVAVPVAAVLAAVALAPVSGLHQVAGVSLVLLLGWTAYGLVTRLFPGLDPVPAATLAAITAVAAVILSVVGLSAATVPLSPGPMSVDLAALAALFQLASETQRRSGLPAGWRRRWRPVLFAGVGVAAAGLMALDAGAVTSRLAPKAAAAPYTAFSFAGPAARWNQQLEVGPGQTLEVPLQVVNRSGRADLFIVSYQLGSARHQLAEVDIAASGQWTATFPVVMPQAGCPQRLSFDAASTSGTETLDVWLQWNDPACL